MTRDAQDVTGRGFSAGEQVMEEFHHIVTKPWIERLERVDADTQKALDLDREVSPLPGSAVADARLGSACCPNRVVPFFPFLDTLAPCYLVDPGKRRAGPLLATDHGAASRRAGRVLSCTRRDCMPCVSASEQHVCGAFQQRARSGCHAMPLPRI